MAVEVEETGSNEKLLKFQISRSEVLESLDKSFEQQEMRMRTRRGGSGEDLRAEIEGKRGDQIRESVKRLMMDEAYAAAIEEKEISAAAKPEFQNVVFDPEKEPALTFEAPVKVWPTYEIKDVGPCKKHLKVSICTERIAAALQQSLQDIQENAAIKGFRRGHAPMRLVERQFGRDIRSELKQRLIAEAFEKVLTQKGISPVGDPDIKVLGEEEEKEGEKPEETTAEKKETKIEEAPIEFEVTLEVEPEFEVEGYTGLKLQKQSEEPTEQEIDAAIDNLRLRAADLEVVEDAAKEGDAVACSYKVTVDGKVIAEAKDAELAATGSNVTGIPAREVAKLLLGAKAGEEKKGKFKLTDAFPMEDMRNKEADVAFTIREIKRLKKPDASDAFAKDLGYDSLSQMREDLRGRVKTNKEQAVRRDLERQISDQLLDKFKFDLPEEMVKRQAAINAQRQQLMLLSRGVPREDVAKEAQAIRSASEDAAVRDFRLYFILEKIADKERIYATEDEVQERVSAMAMMRGVSANRMHQHLERDGSLSTLRRQLREEKTIAFLCDKADMGQSQEAEKKADKKEDSPE